MQSTESIGFELEMAETMFLGLRRSAGVSLSEFRERFGWELLDVYGSVVDELCELRLLHRSTEWIRLTRLGRLLGNEVFVRFLPAGS